jgi:hypothetical protein
MQIPQHILLDFSHRAKVLAKSLYNLFAQLEDWTFTNFWNCIKTQKRKPQESQDKRFHHIGKSNAQLGNRNRKILD